MTQKAQAARFTVTVDLDFAPMIPRFLENRKNEWATMREAISRHDYETVRQVAHGIKGAGGSYGFDGLSSLAGRLEQAAKAANHEDVMSGLDSINVYLSGVVVRFE